MPKAWPIRWWHGIFAAAVTLPLLALLIWSYVVQIQREQNEARETALRIARATAADMQALHHDSLELLERMAARPAIRNFDGTHCDQLFAVVEFLPRFPDLLLFDRNHALVCSATPYAGNEPFARATQEWIGGELRAGRVVEGMPRIRSIDHQWISVVTRNVRDAGGRVIATLALVELPQIVGEETLPRESVITVIDDRGTIVARTEQPDQWIGRNVSNSAVAALALKQREGRVEGLGVDGVNRQYGFAALPEMGWHLYVGLPTAVVMEPVRKMMWRGVIGVSVTIASVIVVAAALARWMVRPINAVARAAKGVAHGSYRTISAVRGPSEMTALATAFNDMVTSRADAERQMHESERNLKALSDRLINIQEQERTRIARELHDDLGQSLTALKMDVGALLKETGATPLRDRILTTLDRTVSAVQRISSELRPSVLDDLGIVAAIESESRLFEERTGVECELSLPETLDVDPAIATVIYRIFQEALTNVSRHSNAARVEVRLRQRGDDVFLDVRDDGIGLNDAQIEASSSLGLIGMRERADLVGGSVTFTGVPSRGTIISVRLPRVVVTHADTP